MRTMNACLSGSNRLSNVQAQAICDSNERYENEYLYNFSDADFTVSGAIGKIRNSIHGGRYVPLYRANRLTIDEVWLLIRRIKLMLSTVSYSNGCEKRSIEKTLPILLNSVSKSRKVLKGNRPRLDTLFSCADENEDDCVDFQSDSDPF